MKINVVTVTYGKRFYLLRKMLESVFYDTRINKVIIVDNGSTNSLEIKKYTQNNKNIILIKNNINHGSAGGFKVGIEEARKNPSDYVLLLDDDNIIEKNWSNFFYNILTLFPSTDKVILKANRNYSFDSNIINKENLYKIDYISIKKIKKIFFREEKNNNTFQPIVYNPNGFNEYGGTLLPFKAILENELPLEKFYLYCDDSEYSYRINKNNYRTYQCYRPIIKDLEYTFTKDLKFLTSFDKNVTTPKIYFRIRNQYILSSITKSQSKLSLIINGIIGITVKILYAFIKLGINKYTIERSKIIIIAFLDGIKLNFNNDTYK